jgi:hypothetical protein
MCIQGCETIAQSVADPIRTLEYSAEAIRGRVIDVKSKQPVEGVVVVAIWELRGGLEGGNILGAVQVLESVTDREGHYHFSAWGPLKYTGRGTLDQTAPALVFFRKGYQATARSNTDPHLHGIRPPYGRISRWDGRTIELEALERNVEATDRNWRTLRGNLLFVDIEPKRCEWKRVPRLILEMMAHAKETGSENSYTRALGHDLFANDDYYKNIGCGSPTDFFRNFKR